MFERKEKKRTTRHSAGKALKWFIVAGGAVALVVAYKIFGIEYIRFDQYMSAICTTTAALVGTMFGLSAASYAFVCGEMRTEEKNGAHLRRIVVKHRENLWNWFVWSLILMLCTVATSLLCLGGAQGISAPDLFQLSASGEKGYYAAYMNGRYQYLSVGVLLNLYFTILAIAAMVRLNLLIFRREKRYIKIAKQIMSDAVFRYVEPEEAPDEAKIRTITPREELEKIHNLERLLKRVLKNHESAEVGIANEGQSGGLLRVVIKQKLEVGFVAQNKEGPKSKDAPWGFVTGEKLDSYWERCYIQASIDCKDADVEDDSKKRTPPECTFAQVYEDLMRYRDGKLMCIDHIPEDEMTGRDGRCLRWSVKRRLLTFLLWEESLDAMDLSRMNLAGANLQHTNFSNSNLSRVNLAGANCEGADFSDARMQGMFFRDNPEECDGEIALSYLDDDKQKWNPYTGRQATCFRGATFAHADVSRAFLVAGKTTWKPEFPFEKEAPTRLYLMEDVSFVSAKLYSSRFRDISFDRASLEQALVFDSVFYRCSVRSVDFQKAVMTNCALFWCDFSGSNGAGAVLARGAIFRCDFSEARLEGASFANANLLHCNFERVSCQNVSFRGVAQDPALMQQICEKNLPFAKDFQIPPDADGLYLNFKFAVLSNTDFSEAHLARACFDQAIGADCIFTQAEGERVSMRDAVLRASVFNETKFIKGCFVRTVFRDSVFVRTQFIGGDFCGADFGGALFNPGTEPCFESVDLCDVSFRGAVGLTASCFHNVTMTGCDLRGTGLKRAVLEATPGVVVESNCLFD